MMYTYLMLQQMDRLALFMMYTWAFFFSRTWVYGFLKKKNGSEVEKRKEKTINFFLEFTK